MEGPHDGPGGDDELRRSRWITTVFSVLANRDRRTILQFLSEHRGESVDIPDLIEVLQTNRPADRAKDASSIEIELHHSHIPKLVESDIVEYDEEAERVTYRGDPFLESGLEIVETDDSTTSDDR